MAEWFEDEAFWEVSYDFMFPPASFEQAREQAAMVLALAGGNVSTVLDLCCGPGRFAIPLAERGLSVTGVDRSAWLLQKAKQSTVDVEWAEQDMREFVRDQAFDLALSLFTSFGYFVEPNENARVLTNVYTSLRPGGRFVIDVMGKERLAAVFTDTSCHELEDGRLRVQRHRVIDDWSRVENRWLFLQDGRYQTFEFVHFIYSGKELASLLEAAGFATVQLHGGLDGSPYDRQASRLVAVATK